ncbi:MAG: hypothetical protein D6705_11185 [Deltaproteobacteria bacterium]|nr:MAG: hypothetical protein D6705_11185 [Deltaproteobacteria bacterium]
MSLASFDVPAPAPEAVKTSFGARPLRSHGGWRSWAAGARRSGRRLRRCAASTTILAWIVGCGVEPAPDPGEAARDRAAPTDAWRFADGTRLTDVVLPAAPVRRGDEVEVRWQETSGAGGRFEVALVEPVAAAEQVVRYGAEGRRRVRPDETFPIGARWHVVPLRTARATVTVPETLRTRHAVVLARRRAGAVLVPAVEGPRREDGLAVLGIVDLDPEPLRVRVPRLRDAPTLDGRLDEPAWADGGIRLVDSRSGRTVERPRATVWFGWNASALYVAARIEDPDVWSTFTDRDAPLWKEEALEVFVGGEGDPRYVELQVSPRCVRFDAAFTAHRKGGPAADLDTRPACLVDGTVDRRDDRDRGWTVEWEIPWASVCVHASVPCAPEAGTRIVANVFVLDRPRKGPPAAAALSPTHVPDFHAMDAAAILELGP